MGRETEGGGRREESMSSERRKKWGGEMKMSGLYREAPLGKGQPRPWTGKLRVLLLTQIYLSINLGVAFS